MRPSVRPSGPSDPPSVRSFRSSVRFVLSVWSCHSVRPVLPFRPSVRAIRPSVRRSASPFVRSSLSVCPSIRPVRSFVRSVRPSGPSVSLVCQFGPSVRSVGFVLIVPPFICSSASVYLFVCRPQSDVHPPPPPPQFICPTDDEMSLHFFARSSASTTPSDVPSPVSPFVCPSTPSPPPSNVCASACLCVYPSIATSVETSARSSFYQSATHSFYAYRFFAALSNRTPRRQTSATVSPSARLSCPSIRPSASPSVCQFCLQPQIHASFLWRITTFVCLLSVNPSVRLPFRPSILSFVYPSVRLPFRPPEVLV